jgi:RNA polymerase sigma factor (sigma-70 family)
MAEGDPPDDDDLAIRMMDGEESALQESLERYAPKVFGYLKSQFKYALKEEEIEEALQRASLKVWEKAETYDSTKGKLSTWFTTIAHNQALDIIRRETRFKVVPWDESCEDIEAIEIDPGEQPLLEHVHDFIYNELVGFERIVGINFYITEEANPKRLAAQHGKSVGTVNVTKHKVKTKIEKEILAFKAKKQTRRAGTTP